MLSSSAVVAVVAGATVVAVSTSAALVVGLTKKFDSFVCFFLVTFSFPSSVAVVLAVADGLLGLLLQPMVFFLRKKAYKKEKLIF